jgi:hypothetical protein
MRSLVVRRLLATQPLVRVTGAVATVVGSVVSGLVGQHLSEDSRSTASPFGLGDVLPGLLDG